MGAIESSTAPPESSLIRTQVTTETKVLNDILQNSPHSEVISIVNKIHRYDSCGIGYSRIKSENYSLAELVWELSSPYELANLAFSHTSPPVRLYAFEGICVLLKTLKNFGHSPYWRLRFQPSDSNIGELEDILYCTLMQLQSDHETTPSMAGCTLCTCCVSATAKRLGWNLLPVSRQRTLEDIILKARIESPEAEQILKTRAESEQTLETYLLLERLLSSKPYLLQYIAMFKKPRDIELIIRYLEHDQHDLVRGGIKAISVWTLKAFWPVISRIHEEHCLKLKENLLETQNHDAILLFFAIHEAIVAFGNEEAVNSLQKSYNSICFALKDQNPRLLHATLSGFYNVIPVTLPYAELLFTMWKEHSFIKGQVLELLLDISGNEKSAIREHWYAFLMGTHPRVGEDSAVRILTRQLDVLDLIFEQTTPDSFRNRSIAFLSDLKNPVWQRGTSKHFDKGMFSVAMSTLKANANDEIVCAVLEQCVRNCTCHDASFVCEYASDVKRPSKGLIEILLERSVHWNFYVHDPARMALLCMNDPAVDKLLETAIEQPLQSLSVYKPVTEGCDDTKNIQRRWKSFM